MQVSGRWVDRRMALRHYGLTSGRLVIADAHTQRAKAAKTLAPLDTRRDQDSGGSRGGHRRVFRWLGPPTLSIPVGMAFDPPAPELRAWSKQERGLTGPGVPTTPRPPQPPAQPPSPTTQALAWRWFQQCKGHHAALSVPGVVAETLYGTSPWGEAASAICEGGHVSPRVRRHQHLRVSPREPPGAASVATPPGTPQTIRIRGGDEMGAMAGRARGSGWAHPTQRCIMALPEEGEETDRELRAAALTWRTLDMVQAPPVRGLVEGGVPGGQSPEGWRPLPKPPGQGGAGRSVSRRLLVAHGLFAPPD